MKCNLCNPFFYCLLSTFQCKLKYVCRSMDVERANKLSLFHISNFIKVKSDFKISTKKIWGKITSKHSLECYVGRRCTCVEWQLIQNNSKESNSAVLGFIWSLLSLPHCQEYFASSRGQIFDVISCYGLSYLQTNMKKLVDILHH